VTTADVVVVGAGVVGASIAFHLASHGTRVVVYDQVLAPFAGPALLWPAAVLITTALTSYPRRNPGAPHQLRRL
jgi:glycine/D-amino acid oxidase-like deaminating enzyme